MEEKVEVRGVLYPLDKVVIQGSDQGVAGPIAVVVVDGEVVGMFDNLTIRPRKGGDLLMEEAEYRRPTAMPTGKLWGVLGPPGKFRRGAQAHVLTHRISLWVVPRRN